MSQPNNFPPSFNYDYFDSQSSQVTNPSFSQWNSQGTRPMGNAPSPSPTVRTAMTAPNPVPYNRPSINQPNIPLPDSRVDPNLASLTYLNVPSAGRPRSAMDNASGVDPVSRLINGSHDDPWSPFRTRNQSIPNSRPVFPQPSLNYGSYRGGPRSDIARSDSGYYTNQAQSVISNEPEHVNQELPPSIPFQTSSITVESASSEQTEVFPMQSDQASQYSGRSGASQNKIYKCPQCKETSKCPSDFKKHILKHEKPYRCDAPNCRRAAAGKGFTTVNDLARHKKSVHRIGVEKDSYRCASENCRNREKIWPRLDNFKQHISRMHKGEDEQELIRRSQWQGPAFAASNGDGPSVAPMDTLGPTLAGMGAGRQLAGNELVDPNSEISLTPDQDTSLWTSFDPSAQDFALDVDRANTGADGPTSGKQNNIPGYGSAGPTRTSSARPNAMARPRQDSLSVLADVASTQTSPDKPVPPSRRQLSSAPQTKAEQQRQALHNPKVNHRETAHQSNAEKQREALQKFSKVIASEIQNTTSSESLDLENVVLRVLYGATKQSKRDSNHSNTAQHPADDMDADIVMTKAEALRASQAISNLIKQSGNPPFSNRPRRPSKGYSPNGQTCQKCGAILARSCDMKKHMKRHTKPYGCTYPKCHKRFGAKSDWKRHENSQHFQLESFRCQLTSPSSQTPCGELFYRVELFKAHLQTEHKVMQQDQLAHELKARRIGRNGQGQFWCGFCQQILRLEKKRNAAWDERFDHIDHHFTKENKSIEDWLCVEAKKTKGDVFREMDKTSFDEDDADDYGVGETDMSPSPPSGETSDPPGQPRPPERPSSASMPAPPPMPQITSHVQKRPAPLDNFAPPPAPKRQRRDVNRYCCACDNGPWPSHTYIDCVNCGHHLCNNCTVYAFVGPEAGMGIGV